MSKNRKNKIGSVILFIFLNVLFLITIYKTTRLKLNFMTFIYMISLIIVDLIFYLLPYKLRNHK